MNLTCKFSIMIVSLFVLSGFSMNVFAQEVTIQTPLSIGNQHEGIMTTTQTSSYDGSIVVFLTSTEPVKGEHMSIHPKFIDLNGNQIQNINYDIIATQNGQVILSETMVNEHIGIGDQLTQVLPSDDQVNIQITLQGMENHPITVSQGKPIDIIVVPEFGTITMMILSISIVSIIAVTAKSRIMPKL